MKINFVLLSTLALLYIVGACSFAAEKPNFVIVFTDDQGYGDLGCFGSQTIRTPRIDHMAREGTKFTSFYADVVCGVSRAALLTGRYPVRCGGWSVPTEEVTIAEVLSDAGYATCCIGKWDISNRQEIIDRMPNAQGFQYYFGPLGANDAGQVKLYENNKPAVSTNDMGRLTKLYTDKGIEFIKQHKDKPFFLYLAHTMVHTIVGASDDFKGKSRGGLYGDAVEELDFHTGRLIDTLAELGLDKNTLVIFTSDNGPWSDSAVAISKRHGGQIATGNAGPLREAKGSTYEGGLREPCVVWWPGRVPAGRTSDQIVCTLDLLPTLASLAGTAPPKDRTIDGKDQTELLLGKSDKSARDEFYYFSMGALHGVRSGKWKMLRATRLYTRSYVKDKGPGKVELFDLESDIGETKNVAKEHPEIVEKLRAKMKAAWPDQFGPTPPPNIDRKKLRDSKTVSEKRTLPFWSVDCAKVEGRVLGCVSWGCNRASSSQAEKIFSQHLFCVFSVAAGGICFSPTKIISDLSRVDLPWRIDRGRSLLLGLPPDSLRRLAASLQLAAFRPWQSSGNGGLPAHFRREDAGKQPSET